MDPKEYYLNNTYHIQVRETLHDHTIEWFGILTIFTQPGGEVSINLTFDDQPVEYSSGEQL